MPKAAKETKSKPRAKTFEDVFVTKPEHEHCKQVLASKRIRDVCFTAWDTSREPYFPEDKGCYYLAANLEICPTTGREHWQEARALVQALIHAPSPCPSPRPSPSSFLVLACILALALALVHALARALARALFHALALALALLHALARA